MRIRITLDIVRGRRDRYEPEFEHRDTDSVTESTYGGDPDLHRMGFVAPHPADGRS